MSILHLGERRGGCVSTKSVSTGVKGLDEMLDGGFPKGRVILLSGGPGTGKTVFSLQFLAAAAERGEAGVYVTLEEPIDLVRENIAAFGWDLEKKEATKRLRLLDLYTVTHETEPSLSVVDKVTGALEEIKAEHVVIDPVTSITIHERTAGGKRYRIAEIFNRLRKAGCTSIFTSEMASLSGEFYMEEFLADGVIRLEKTLQNFSLIKTIRIEKMRGVKYDEQPRRYVIDERGFTVYSTEPVRGEKQ